MEDLLTVPEGASVDLALRGSVLEIAFNQPERRNPLSYGTANGLIDVLERADRSPDVRVVLLYGQGDDFTAGGDLSEFSSQSDARAHDLHVTGEAWERLLMTIPRMTKPLITAAHGYVMAGGIGLVAAADVALAANQTTFATNEVRIGLFPLMILPTLGQAIGPRRARELALTGRRIHSEEALRIGLVHEVLSDADFLEAARARADAMARLGRTTLSLGKSYLHHIEGVPRESATHHGRSARGAFMTSPDFREGVAAFLEKRPPQFE